MKELLYFSFSDLMVRVEYCQDANSLRYSSHRKITFGERVIVEQYLLTNVAIKTDYYKRYPSLLIYLGINSKLAKDLNLFHLKNTLKFLNDKDKNVQNSVKHLIDQSMTNYYFEQIGNTILEIRKLVSMSYSDVELRYFENKLEELIEAYNIYAERKVSFEEVLPKELKPLFLV
ncbi:MAG: hypothetical protein ACE5HO_05010 [bacterium]